MRGDQAYVGHSAFAIKAAYKRQAVLQIPPPTSHISPKAVRKTWQRVLLKVDLSGKGSILYKAEAAWPRKTAWTTPRVATFSIASSNGRPRL